MKKLISFGLFLLIIITVLLLSSCGPGYYLTKSKKFKEIAIRKGAIVKPDTVYKYKNFYIKLPAENKGTDIHPVLDTTKLDSAFNKYDSLSKVVDTSTSNEDKLEAKKEREHIKKRIAQGFAKDSTYIFQPDSITSVSVTIKNGLPSKLDYKRKEATITKKEKTAIAVNEKIEVHSNKQLIVYGFLILVIGFILGHLKKQK